MPTSRSAVVWGTVGYCVAALGVACTSGSSSTACSGASCADASTVDGTSADASGGGDDGAARGPMDSGVPPVDSSTDSSADATADATETADGSLSDAMETPDGPASDAGCAAPGLDPSFGDAGVVSFLNPAGDNVGPVAVQPDGKVLAGISPIGATVQVLRLGADGAPDMSFGSGGTATLTLPSGTAYLLALTLQPDGKILVGGETVVKSTQSWWLARLAQDGTLDLGFGTGGYATPPVANGRVEAIALRQNGAIVVGGDVGGGGAYNWMVSQFDPSGQLDTSFGTGGVTTVLAAEGIGRFVQVLADDSVIIAGTTSVPRDGGHWDEPMVGRLVPEGGLDPSFGTKGLTTVTFGAGYYQLNGATIQSSGDIVLGSSAELGAADEFTLARLTAGGTLDPNFGAQGILNTGFFGAGDDLSIVALLPGDALLVGGTVRLPADAAAAREFGVTRLSADGGTDTTFADGGKLTMGLAGRTSTIFSAGALGAPGTLVVSGFDTLASDAGAGALVSDLLRMECVQ
jgi:uncharacterized delta-60 repeat protein